MTTRKYVRAGSSVADSDSLLTVAERHSGKHSNVPFCSAQQSRDQDKTSFQGIHHNSYLIISRKTIKITRLYKKHKKSNARGVSRREKQMDGDGPVSLFRKFQLLEEIRILKPGQDLAADNAAVRIYQFVVWYAIEIE